MARLKLVTAAPEPASTTTTSRSSIAKAAQAKDKPERPYEVRSERTPGLLLRVQPSSARTFYVQLGRGKRVRIGSAGIFTLAQAEEAAKAILRDPEKHATKKYEGATLAGWLADHYEEHALAKLKGGARSVARVKAIWAPLLKKRMADIKPSDIDSMRNKRLLAGIAPATVNRDISALRGVVTHWAEHSKSPNQLAGFEPLKVPDDERIRYLSPAEAKRLRKVLADRNEAMRAARVSYNEWAAERGYELKPEHGTYPDHMTPMVLLSLNTGLRQGELFSLEWSSVDLTHKTLTVKASHAKGNATRHIPLNTEALAVLTTIKPEKATGLVFKSPVTGERFNNVKRAWAEITKTAKMPDLRWHDLRHDFASQLVMRAVPLFTVQKLLGHANSRMTQRYARLAPHTLADAVEMLT